MVWDGEYWFSLVQCWYFLSFPFLGEMFFVVFYESRFEQKWLRTTFCSHIFQRKYYTTQNYRKWMVEINVFNSFSAEHEITIKIIVLHKTIMYKNVLTQFKLSVSWEKKIYGKECEEPVCVGPLFSIHSRIRSVWNHLLFGCDCFFAGCAVHIHRLLQFQLQPLHFSFHVRLL